MDRAISKLPFELGIGPFVHGRLRNLTMSEDSQAFEFSVQSMVNLDI